MNSSAKYTALKKRLYTVKIDANAEKKGFEAGVETINALKG